MKKTLVLFGVAMLCLSCVPSADTDSQPVTDRGSIIDVRTAQEYAQGHLDTATNIPYTEIGEKIAAHVSHKEERITVYCRSGRRSAIAKQTLESLGYTNVVDAGAYATLKNQESGNE